MPPSSIVVFLTVSAHCFNKILPTGVEPVKETCDILKDTFGADERVSILQVGIGSEAGFKNIHISNVSEVSTFSEAFIEKYKTQKTFEINWNNTSSVEIKTLDELISLYGLPDFCKVDVEGYELEVLKGLSQALPAMSLEYNAKLKNVAIDCINELSKFDALSYNFSPYESMEFSFSLWQQPTEFLAYIKGLPKEMLTGDIYVKNNAH